MKKKKEKEREQKKKKKTKNRREEEKNIQKSNDGNNKRVTLESEQSNWRLDERIVVNTLLLHWKGGQNCLFHSYMNHGLAITMEGGASGPSPQEDLEV